MKILGKKINIKMSFITLYIMPLHDFHKIAWIKLHNNENIKLIEQLKRLASAITYCIHSEQTLLIVDYVIVDGKEKPLSSCIDIETLNKQIKKWHIVVFDRHFYKYKSAQVYYGININEKVNITNYIVGENDGHIKLNKLLNPNATCGGDPYPGIAKQIEIMVECNNINIISVIQEHCERLTHNFDFNFKDLNKDVFTYIPSFRKQPESDDIYNEVVNIF